ncbi:hypothetical protein SS50377_26483 [Spironucleus salmonicida]|uniref:Uncharacterized protein n=1 Tax=Spironucleus salmonicida TaxID=348837 RepID=V6LKY3_9EUKA|nr:hypothetical protein SS50377_26483 [Spironucleus salmonicida]|eukprot:EST41339.1 hypothetical protein SS50377_19052 [Spironucleus salmonicida]
MDGERKNNFTSVMRLPQVDQKMASGAIQVLGSHVILDEAENLQFELDGTVLVVKMFAVDQKKLRKMILSFMESYESFNEIWTGFDEKE